MNLVEMKQKRKRGKGESLGSASDDDGPTLHLNDGHLESLGMGATPKPGDKLHVRGHAEVVHSSESADEDGKTRHVTLRLTHMAARKRSGEKSVRQELEEAAEKKGIE